APRWPAFRPAGVPRPDARPALQRGAPAGDRGPLQDEQGPAPARRRRQTQLTARAVMADLLTAEPNDAAPFVPEKLTLRSLREAAAGCRGCHLWRHATQTVFGEGLKRARMMMVGEMPGDREDRQGKPFVGPAGRVLDKALDAVGIDRKDVYITNVVKHFAFEERGKRR